MDVFLETFESHPRLAILDLPSWTGHGHLPSLFLSPPGFTGYLSFPGPGLTMCLNRT